MRAHLLTAELGAIPAMVLRGGTSKGVFLHPQDLPADKSLWGPYLIALFGARDARQIDGLGGASPTTSKCCIVGPSERTDADVDYTFAQIGIGEEKVYWDFNCGNLTPAVATFSVLSGLVPATSGSTTVRIYQTNTATLLSVDLPTDADGRPVVEGPLEIAGVSGTGSATMTDLSATVGSSLGGALLPTGNRTDRLDVPGIGPVECSIVDLANMCVFFRAEDVGLTGLELPEHGPAVVGTFIAMRRAAQERLGIDPAKTTPWPVCVTDPKAFDPLDGAHITAGAYDVAVRFAGIQPMRDTLHEAFPGTASCCTALAAVLPGTVVNQIYARRTRPVQGRVALGHPSGIMHVEAALRETAVGPVVERAAFGRTVRLIMGGCAYVRLSDVDRLAARLDPDAPTRRGVPVPAVAT